MMGSGCQDAVKCQARPGQSRSRQTHTEGESSRAHRVRKARMGPRNAAPLIPAHTRQTTAWGVRRGEERQKGRGRDPKGDIKGQELTWVQGTGSASFARLGTPSDPSRTAQKCICAGSPCEIALPSTDTTGANRSQHVPTRQPAAAEWEA